MFFRELFSNVYRLSLVQFFYEVVVFHYYKDLWFGCLTISNKFLLEEFINLLSLQTAHDFLQ